MAPLLPSLWCWVASARTGRTAALALVLLLAPLPWALCAEAQLPDVEAFGGGLGFLDDDFVHMKYKFQSVHMGSARYGTGELWLSFAGGVPRVRLKGYAFSPRFGHGEITLVLDSSVREMYALLRLGELREAQCMSFPFPRSTDDPSRLERLRWRKNQVAMHWQELPAEGPAPGEELEVKWTKSYTLDLLIKDWPRDIRGVNLRQGNRTVKSVRLEAKDREGENTSKTFAMPDPNCTPVAKVSNPLLMVEIKPPHHRSSALGDLLLVLADRVKNGGNWPRSFLALCAVVVPGDVAVMIEAPDPPDLSKFGSLSFDYKATVYRLGGNVSFDDPAADLRRHGSGHSSKGQLHLDLNGRSLRLHGEESETKVGPVVTDLLAHAKAESPQLYANVQLPAQDEHHCGVYSFPQSVNSDAAGAEALERASGRGLSFVGIDELDGEDCAIFSTSLPRGRRIFVWVDMESERPGEFLRAEIRKGGRRLRSLDVMQWHSTSSEAIMEQRPPAEWNCTDSPSIDTFVHLGLRDLQTWSVELQDALRSLRELPREFVVLEMLALAGDVCLMVKEPEAPELWRFPKISFGYTLFLSGIWTGTHEGPCATGRLAVDHQAGRFQLTAHSANTGSVNLSLNLEAGLLSVRVQQVDSEHCIALPLGKRPLNTAARPMPGVFDGVEQVGDADCDRFSFVSPEAAEERSVVRFWLSNEKTVGKTPIGVAMSTSPGSMGGKICQLQIAPPPGHGDPSLMFVTDWEESFKPASSSTSFERCVPASETTESWLEFDARPGPFSRLEPKGLWPAGEGLGKIVEVATILGVLTQQWVADPLSRLILHTPPVGTTLTTTTTKAPLSLFAPELQSFSFSFSSTYVQPLQQARGMHSLSYFGGGHRGTGEIRVDLEWRRLYLKSKAKNVSAGIASLESEIFYSAERGRVYARTRLAAEGYEQCWSVGVAALPSPAKGASRNPFLRARLEGRGTTEGGAVSPGLDKYMLRLDAWKRAELFVDEHSALSAIHFDDHRNGASVGVMVSDWSTEPIPKEKIEADSGGACRNVHQLDQENRQILAWDIIRFLFPVES